MALGSSTSFTCNWWGLALSRRNTGRKPLGPLERCKSVLGPCLCECLRKSNTELSGRRSKLLQMLVKWQAFVPLNKCPEVISRTKKSDKELGANDTECLTLQPFCNNRWVANNRRPTRKSGQFGPNYLAEPVLDPSRESFPSLSNLVIQMLGISCMLLIPIILALTSFAWVSFKVYFVKESLCLSSAFSRTNYLRAQQIACGRVMSHSSRFFLSRWFCVGSFWFRTQKPRTAETFWYCPPCLGFPFRGLVPVAGRPVVVNIWKITQAEWVTRVCILWSRH